MSPAWLRSFHLEGQENHYTSFLFAFLFLPQKPLLHLPALSIRKKAGMLTVDLMQSAFSIESLIVSFQLGFPAFWPRHHPSNPPHFLPLKVKNISPQRSSNTFPQGFFPTCKTFPKTFISSQCPYQFKHFSLPLSTDVTKKNKLNQHICSDLNPRLPMFAFISCSSVVGVKDFPSVSVSLKWKRGEVKEPQKEGSTWKKKRGSNISPLHCHVTTSFLCRHLFQFLVSTTLLFREGGRRLSHIFDLEKRRQKYEGENVK